MTTNLDDLVHPLDAPTAPPATTVDDEPVGQTFSRAARLRSASRSWAALPPLGPWARDARCRDLDHDTAEAIFFPTSGEAYEARFDVRFYCGNCPVQVECRDYAREYRPAGHWGGESESERADGRLRWTA